MNKKILESFEQKLLTSNNIKESLSKMTLEEIKALLPVLDQIDTEDEALKHLKTSPSSDEIIVI